MRSKNLGALERLKVNAARAEDCLQRALDGMEGGPDSTDWEYVNRQVDLAHDAVIEVNATLLAFFQSWLEALA